MNHHPILAYDNETYIDHNAAKNDKKLFKTNDSMDFIESKSGFSDLLEMVELFQKASGRKDIVYGITSGIHFISVDEIKEKYEENENDSNVRMVIDTSEIIEDILLDKNVFKFTISAKAILGDDYEIPRSSQTGKLANIDDTLKMDVIKKIGRSVSNDKTLLNKFPEEFFIVREEMKRIQLKEVEDTLGMG